MDLLTATFWIFSGWAIFSALLCIPRRNPLASALWLVSTMFALAALFVLLNAQFIAAIQVIVYAGAVMVLFLFVIMLLNLENPPSPWLRKPFWLIGLGVAAVLGAQLVTLGNYDKYRLADEFSSRSMPDPALVFPDGPGALQAFADRGVVGGIAEPLFRSYLIPFEITSVLLLVAVVGAVVLAKKRL